MDSDGLEFDVNRIPLLADEAAYMIAWINAQRADPLTAATTFAMSIDERCDIRAIPEALLMAAERCRELVQANDAAAASHILDDVIAFVMEHYNVQREE